MNRYWWHDMAKSYVAYNDFRGGLNVDASIEQLKDNELETAINIDLTMRGGFEKRKGITPINSTSYNAQVDDLFEWIKKDGTIELMAVMSDALYKIDADGTATKIISLAQGTRSISKEAFRGVLYFGDGVDRYYYDGEGAGSVQISTSPGAPVIVGSGSGSFTGTWKGLVVYVNDLDIESPASSIETTGTISSKCQIDWTNITVGGANVTKRRLYRTKNGGSIYYFLAEIDDNTTTTYTDTTTDVNLGAALVTDNNLSSVKFCKYAFWHSKSYRWFYAGNKYDQFALYYSEANDPHYCKAISVLYPTHNLGAIIGIKEFADSVMVFYKYGCRIWRGSDPDKDALWEEIPLQQGSVSNEAIAVTPNSLTFLSQGGLYSISPSLFSMPSNIISNADIVTNISEDKVNSIIREITNPQYTQGIFDATNNRYMLAYSTSSTVRNDKVLIYDWSLDAYTVYDGWTVNAWLQRYNGDMLFASDGYIYKTGQGYSDNGKAISAKVKTKRYHLGYPSNEKTLFKIFANAKPGGDKLSSVDVKVISEKGSKAYTNIDLTNSFIWGQAWGGNWGSTDLLQKEMKVKIKGTRFQVEYSNDTKNEAMCIYGQLFQFKTKKPAGDKIKEDEE